MKAKIKQKKGNGQPGFKYCQKCGKIARGYFFCNDCFHSITAMQDNHELETFNSYMPDRSGLSKGA